MPCPKGDPLHTCDGYMTTQSFVSMYSKRWGLVNRRCLHRYIDVVRRILRERRGMQSLSSDEGKNLTKLLPVIQCCLLGVFKQASAGVSHGIAVHCVLHQHVWSSFYKLKRFGCRYQDEYYEMKTQQETMTLDLFSHQWQRHGAEPICQSNLSLHQVCQIHDQKHILRRQQQTITCFQRL